MIARCLNDSRFQDKILAQKPILVSIIFQHFEKPGHPPFHVPDAEPLHPDFPEMLVLHVFRRDTVGFLEVVEEVQDEGEVEVPDPGRQADLEGDPVDREVYQGVSADPGDLLQGTVQVWFRQVFEDVRSDHRIEPSPLEHVHLVDASDVIRPEGPVDVKGGHFVSSPLENFGSQPLPGTHDQYFAALRKGLEISVLVVAIHEIGEVQPGKPLLTIHGENSRGGNLIWRHRQNRQPSRFHVEQRQKEPGSITMIGQDIQKTLMEPFSGIRSKTRDGSSRDFQFPSRIMW